MFSICMCLARHGACAFLIGKTAPHKNIDFASAKSSFGMQHADTGGLPNCLGRRSAGTSGCHGYIVIAEKLIGNLSKVLVTLP
jgi:hypothetical protein